MRLRCDDCNNETEFVKVVAVNTKNKPRIALTKWKADLVEYGEQNHGQWDKSTTRYRKVNSCKGKGIFCSKCKSDNIIVYASLEVNPYK